MNKFLKKEEDETSRKHKTTFSRCHIKHEITNNKTMMMMLDAGDQAITDDERTKILNLLELVSLNFQRSSVQYDAIDTDSLISLVASHLFDRFSFSSLPSEERNDDRNSGHMSMIRDTIVSLFLKYYCVEEPDRQQWQYRLFERLDTGDDCVLFKTQIFEHCLDECHLVPILKRENCWEGYVNFVIQACLVQQEQEWQQRQQQKQMETLKLYAVRHLYQKVIHFCSQSMVPVYPRMMNNNSVSDTKGTATAELGETFSSDVDESHRERVRHLVEQNLETVMDMAFDIAKRPEPDDDNSRSGNTFSISVFNTTKQEAFDLLDHLLYENQLFGTPSLKDTTRKWFHAKLNQLFSHDSYNVSDPYEVHAILQLFQKAAKSGLNTQFLLHLESFSRLICEDSLLDQSLSICIKICRDYGNLVTDIQTATLIGITFFSRVCDIAFRTRVSGDTQLRQLAFMFVADYFESETDLVSLDLCTLLESEVVSALNELTERISRCMDDENRNAILSDTTFIIERSLSACTMLSKWRDLSQWAYDRIAPVVQALKSLPLTPSLYCAILSGMSTYDKMKAISEKLLELFIDVSMEFLANNTDESVSVDSGARKAFGLLKRGIRSNSEMTTYILDHPTHPIRSVVNQYIATSAYGKQSFFDLGETLCIIHQEGHVAKLLSPGQSLAEYIAYMFNRLPVLSDFGPKQLTLEHYHRAIGHLLTNLKSAEMQEELRWRLDWTLFRDRITKNPKFYRLMYLELVLIDHKCCLIDQQTHELFVQCCCKRPTVPLNARLAYRELQLLIRFFSRTNGENELLRRAYVDEKPLWDRYIAGRLCMDKILAPLMTDFRFLQSTV